MHALFFSLRLARHRQIAEPELIVESSEDSDEGTWHPEREESSEDEEEEEEVDDEVGRRKLDGKHDMGPLMSCLSDISLLVCVLRIFNVSLLQIWMPKCLCSKLRGDER